MRSINVYNQCVKAPRQPRNKYEVVTRQPGVAPCVTTSSNVQLESNVVTTQPRTNLLDPSLSGGEREHIVELKQIELNNEEL